MTTAELLAVTALAVAVAGLLIGLVTTLRLGRAAARGRRDRDDLAALQERCAALAGELEALRTSHRPVPGDDEPGRDGPAAGDPAAYVITGLEPDRTPTAATAAPAPTARLEGRLFADLVLRESVVKAAALAHGVRRAASPEVRDRVRLEVRRELRRARKQRRADLRAARRHLHAEQRLDPAGEDAA